MPGYDCFIQEHNVAFQSGSIIAQVAQAVIMIVGTAGLGTGLVVAGIVARVAIKEALQSAATALKRQAMNAARFTLHGCTVEPARSAA